MNAACARLGIPLNELARRIGSSERTSQRWSAGSSSVHPVFLADAARLVFPVDAPLAAELAAAGQTTLEALGLVAPAPPEEKAPPVPRHLLGDAIACAAADVARTTPARARAALAAAFARARELGVSAEEVAALVAGEGAAADRADR